jgi:hypothetical protein
LDWQIGGFCIFTPQFLQYLDIVFIEHGVLLVLVRNLAIAFSASVGTPYMVSLRGSANY